MKAHLFIWQDTLRHSTAAEWWGTTVSTVLMLARYSLRGHHHNGHLYRRSGWMTGPHRPIMPACNYPAVPSHTSWGRRVAVGQEHNVFVNIWAAKFLGRNPDAEGSEWKGAAGSHRSAFARALWLKKKTWNNLPSFRRWGVTSTSYF